MIIFVCMQKGIDSSIIHERREGGLLTIFFLHGSGEHDFWAKNPYGH